MVAHIICAFVLFYESSTHGYRTWTLEGFKYSTVVRITKDFVLIKSNKMQQYAGIYLLQNRSLHVSGVHRTHHQVYIKL
jgi:hypothetical protein